MKYLLFFTTSLFLGCFNNLEKDYSNLPKNLSLKSVEFGIIKKENVHGFKRIEYPNQVVFCINNLNNLRQEVSKHSKAALFIDQKITTKNDVVWVDVDEHMPFYYIDDYSDCFNLCMYNPLNHPSVEKDLIRGNIKSYKYTVKVSLCTGCDKKILFSGEVTDF